MDPQSNPDHGHAMYVAAAKKRPVAPTLTPPAVKAPAKGGKPKPKLLARKVAKIPSKKAAKQPPKPSAEGAQLLAALAQVPPRPIQQGS